MLFGMLPYVSSLGKRDCPLGDSLDHLSYTSFKIFVLWHQAYEQVGQWKLFLLETTDLGPAQQ